MKTKYDNCCKCNGSKNPSFGEVNQEYAFQQELSDEIHAIVQTMKNRHVHEKILEKKEKKDESSSSN